jgi:hypothetical protein
VKIKRNILQTVLGIVLSPLARGIASAESKKEGDKEVVGEGKEESWRDSMKTNHFSHLRVALTSGLVTEPVMDLHSIQKLPRS